MRNGARAGMPAPNDCDQGSSFHVENLTDFSYLRKTRLDLSKVGFPAIHGRATSLGEPSGRVPGVLGDLALPVTLSHTTHSILRVS